MAKPLGPKSTLIRQAIKSNPDLGNAEIAHLINGSDEAKKGKIEVKPADVAQQKQAMKKAGETLTAPTADGGKKQGRRKGVRRGGRKAAAPRAQAQGSGNPAELLDRVFGLAQECGGIGTLKRLVDRMAELQS